MIITRSWLNEFIDLSDISTQKICDTLNSIGLEVDSVKSYRVPSKVILGKVLSKKAHPNADKLSICEVDLGTYTRQIVCGATNVEAMQYVPVATLGCRLSDNFIIKPVKLRGVESDGMICSSQEIGLPKLNDGILVLDKSIGTLNIGADLSNNIVLNDDVIEIELTANRGDALSIYGVARDIGVKLHKQLKPIVEFKDDHTKGVGRVLQFIYDNDIDSKIGYKVINFQEAHSTLLVTLRLNYIDKLRDNIHKNIVEYMTHTTGVLFSVYDYDSFYVEAKEKAILNVKKDSFGCDTLYNADEKIISNIGIKQLQDFKLNPEGEKIYEVSFINGDIVSQKVYDNSLKSDDRFYKSSRGSESNIEFGIKYLSQFLNRCFKCDIYAGFATFCKNYQPLVVSISVAQVENIIGQYVSSTKIVYILQSLGLKVTMNADTGEALVVVPEFRSDIKNINDIIEEIVRMIGIENIESRPLNFIEKNRLSSSYLEYKRDYKLRILSISQGFYESVTYVFDNKELQLKYGFDVIGKSLDILNPITSELNTFRTTLVLNLLDAVIKNYKNGYRKIEFFEIGSVYNSKREESKKLAFISSGYKSKPSINNSGKSVAVDFEYFASKLTSILGEFRLEKLDTIDNKLTHPYQSAKVIQNDTVIGYISKLHNTVQNSLDIDTTYFAEFDYDKIKTIKYEAKVISKYQSVTNDITISILKEIEYKQISDYINSKEYLYLVDFMPLDIYDPNKDQGRVNLTIRFILRSNSKTLDENDIKSVMNIIQQDLNEKFNANN